MYERKRSITVCRIFQSLNASMLQVCKILLAFIKKSSSATGFPISFSNGEVSTELSRLITDDVVHRMLEVEDYQCIDMVFPLISGYGDHAIGYIEE